MNATKIALHLHFWKIYSILFTYGVCIHTKMPFDISYEWLFTHICLISDTFFSECEFRTTHLSMLNLITSAYQDMIFVTWYINYPFQLWLSKKSDLCSPSSHSSKCSMGKIWSRVY